MLAVWQVLFYSHYHVDVVGHDADFPDLYHFIEVRNLLYLLVVDGLSEFCQFYVSSLLLCGHNQSPQYRQPAINHQCQQISAFAVIVMPWLTALHIMSRLFDFYTSRNRFFSISGHYG